MPSASQPRVETRASPGGIASLGWREESGLRTDSANGIVQAMKQLQEDLWQSSRHSAGILNTIR